LYLSSSATLAVNDLDFNMDLTATGIALAGGIGLFLAGMWLMTDGLKLAAGNTLRNLLRNWTNTRIRALGAGFMITGIVQSSSAVTVATIGFANAGLLNLQQAVWVIFGSNVGTTMTGWIVALVGFKIDMEVLALPLVALGMLTRLTGNSTRRMAIGQALVGFGLFFLGISVMKDGFTDQLSGFTLPTMETGRAVTVLVFILVGMLLTTLMQSSSAAMVITLGAAETGMIPLASAAAVVIGTNLGTTTTAILSVWGATATAKRVAASHVLFNLITAAAAIIIMLPMLQLVAWVQNVLDLAETPAMTLALYHTTFNVLGVIIMWPLSRLMLNRLNDWFVAPSEKAGKPQHIDNTALEVPALAVDSLLKEMKRAQQLSLQSARNNIIQHASQTAPTVGQNSLEQLLESISGFVASLGRKDLPDTIASSLPVYIQLGHQCLLLDELASDARLLQEKIHISDDAMMQLIEMYRERVVNVLDSVMPELTSEDLAAASVKLESVIEHYDALKYQILKSGSSGQMGMVTVDALLQHSLLLRRVAKLAVKISRRILELRMMNSNNQQA